jgi:hypothetical protein
MTTTDTYQSLSEHFPREIEKTRPQGGQSLTYIPVSEVIQRMNTVLGVDAWDSEIVSAYRDPSDPEYIVAHVRVTATINGKRVVRDGLGGQTIKRTRSGEILDLGNDFKGAASDAFKKACTYFGVALYLSRSEESLEIEEAMRAAADIDPQSAQLYDTLKSYLAKMDADEKATMKTWWSEKFPDERAPSAHSSSDVLIDAISWCVEKAFTMEEA